jgi:hypothetical protein
MECFRRAGFRWRSLLRTKVRPHTADIYIVLRRIASLSSVGVLLGGFLFGQAVPPPAPTSTAVDQTAEFQKSIDSLAVNSVLDCGSQRYFVVALQLKSGITLQNCRFQTSPGALDFASPITLDGRSAAISNVIIRNVQVDGNRHSQTNIGYSGEEDGGRHCFRLLGNVSNVLIENSSGTNCASDGIALVSYGVSQSDSALPFQNIVVRNSAFSSNRRHGGSADGISGLTFENVTFSENGTTVPGGSQGDQCASSGGTCYGTGFWYEDYATTVAGEGLNDLLFSRCIFRNNYQRSLFFYARGLSSAPDFQVRGPVRILNSYLDSGAQPLAEDYAIQFQVDESLVGQGPAFQNILVQNSVLSGSVGFRAVASVALNSSDIKTSVPYAGFSAYSTQIAFSNAQLYGKQLAASMDPSGGNSPLVTYSGPQGIQSFSTSAPQTGSFSKGAVIWNMQTNLAPSGWICVASGNPCLQWQSF